MANDDSPSWLPEPTALDDSWGRRGEQPLEWIARSTLPRATAARQFLNNNLTKLPAAAQAAIFRDVRTRLQSAFFELVVALTLQELGGSLTMEQEQAGGRRPDFLVRFPGSTIVVEATSPVIDAEAGDIVKDRNPLLDIVESAAPNGWRILVGELPLLGPTDSKKAFKRAVQRMLAVPPPDPDAARMDLVEQLPQGVIELTLFPGDPGDQPIWMEPGFAVFGDAEQRIRHAVAKKKPQVRNAAVPVLLAINAGSLIGSLEAFDSALLGRRVGIVNHRGEEVATRFDFDGAFATTSGGRSSPIVAGVLAFVGVGFTGFPDPVLYIHPRFQGVLPGAVLALEQRTFDHEAGAISTKPARRSGIVEQLGFVKGV